MVFHVLLLLPVRADDAKEDGEGESQARAREETEQDVRVQRPRQGQERERERRQEEIAAYQRRVSLSLSLLLQMAYCTAAQQQQQLRYWLLTDACYDGFRSSIYLLFFNSCPSYQASTRSGVRPCRNEKIWCSHTGVSDSRDGELKKEGGAS